MFDCYGRPVLHAGLHPNFRYPDAEDGFLKSCYLGYFRCSNGNPLTISDSTGEPVPMESEIVRVVSLNTTEISEISQ